MATRLMCAGLMEDRMRLTEENWKLANELRTMVQQKTETISDGEGVAMFLLWTFLLDHANIQGLDINTLGREQLEAFIRYAGDKLKAAGKH
jgi:hypothetical protein